MNVHSHSNTRNYLFFKFGFRPCKAEQSLRGIKVQEKQKEQDEKDIGKLFRKN